MKNDIGMFNQLLQYLKPNILDSDSKMCKLWLLVETQPLVNIRLRCLKEKKY